jgi:enolase
MMNILNGGAHADNKNRLQEFMVRQLALHFQRRIGMGVDIFHALKLY